MFKCCMLWILVIVMCYVICYMCMFAPVFTHSMAMLRCVMWHVHMWCHVSNVHIHSKTIKSKLQLIVSAFAKSLEIIPRQLAENAGFDSTDILNQLRAKHAKGRERGMLCYVMLWHVMSCRGMRGGAWYAVKWHVMCWNVVRCHLMYGLFTWSCLISLPFRWW